MSIFNLKNEKILQTIGICLLIVIVVTFALAMIGSASAKQDYNQEHIEQNLKEMKRLAEINLKNGCAANSEQYNRLQKANEALQGSF